MKHGTMKMKKHSRNDLENFIAHENEILEECVGLLNRRIPLSDWPYDVRVAFLLALQAEGEGGEAYKAFSTARHLRIDRQSLGYHVPKNSTAVQRRCSERIRADLSGLVKLGSGSYLLSE